MYYCNVLKLCKLSSANIQILPVKTSLVQSETQRSQANKQSNNCKTQPFCRTEDSYKIRNKYSEVNNIGRL